MKSYSATTFSLVATILACTSPLASAFLVGNPSSHHYNGASIGTTTTKSTTQLQMGLDLVTYLRTEWISASLCTNQIPAASTSVLQIGTEDGRAVNFIPRTVEQLITSSADEGGELSVACRRQLKQQRDRRATGIIVNYIDQPGDDLFGTEDESVDVVISLQAADRMRENGMNWKKSLMETARVLKPGGRFLFVEKTEIEGESYIEKLMSIATLKQSDKKQDGKEGEEEEEETYPVFELIGYDDVDLVIVPHIAGVVTKAAFAGMTAAEIDANEAAKEKARIADLSITAFERGLKKRKKKKNKKNQAAEETAN